MLHTIWIILTILSFITPVILIFIAPYIKKVTNNYFFWIVLGGLCLTLLFVGRFINEWTDYTNGNHSDVATSRAWLLDICPACAFLICVLVIIDPSRKLAQAIAPITIFGALLTMFGNMITDQWWVDNTPDQGQGWFNWIVFGNSMNPMYFMMHYINIVMGTLVLLSTPKIKFKQYLYTNLFAVIYYGYVLICIGALNIHEYVSGLQPYDWQYGEYNGVMQVLGLPNNLWYLAALIGLFFSYGIIVLIICLFSIIQRSRKYRWYGIRSYKWWYKGYYDPYSPLDNI
jgi:hypothetical protein